MFALDLDLLHAVQSVATPWLTLVMRLASWLFTPEIVLPVIGSVLIVLLARHKRSQELLLILILAGNLLTPAMKLLVHRDRPNATQATVLDHQGSYSWPSGHAVAVMTIGGAVILLAHHRQRASRWLAFLVSCVVLLVGISRVYLGAHWPSDVLAGYAIGWLWLVFVWRVIRPWVHQRWPRLNDSAV